LLEKACAALKPGEVALLENLRFHAMVYKVPRAEVKARRLFP
jgi:3-phosphoglycerate kinase